MQVVSKYTSRKWKLKNHSLSSLQFLVVSHFHSWSIIYERCGGCDKKCHVGYLPDLYKTATHSALTKDVLCFSASAMAHTSLSQISLAPRLKHDSLSELKYIEKKANHIILNIYIYIQQSNRFGSGKQYYKK